MNFVEIVLWILAITVVAMFFSEIPYRIAKYNNHPDASIIRLWGYAVTLGIIWIIAFICFIWIIIVMK